MQGEIRFWSACGLAQVPQFAFFLLFLFATGVGSLFRAWQARGAASDAVSKSPRQRMRSLSFFRGARP